MIHAHLFHHSALHKVCACPLPSAFYKLQELESVIESACGTAHCWRYFPTTPKRMIAAFDERGLLSGSCNFGRIAVPE
jgi:hypothetical protein